MQEEGQRTKRVSVVLEDLHQNEGSEDRKTHKTETKQSLLMFKKPKKKHDAAVGLTYKLLHNLLSSDAQTQWDCIDCKIHGCDSWTGVNGVMTKGKTRGHWWSSKTKDCVELHKLTVFSSDAAEQQKHQEAPGSYIYGSYGHPQ